MTKTTEEIIKLWKELNIKLVDFEFSCGGDSMNDTNIIIFNKDEVEIENKEIEEYFDEQVYDHVEFYVNSDGHYNGEAGNVEITLNEDEDDFEYSKATQTEWSENYQVDVEFEFTDTELALLNKLGITKFQGDYDTVEPTYSVDVIITDEEEKEVDIIEQRIQDKVNDEHPGEDGDYYTFEINVDKKKALIDANYSVIEYKDGDE